MYLCFCVVTFLLHSKWNNLCYSFIYRLIHKSLRDFRPLRCSNRDGHAGGEHVIRGRDTPSFCPSLQVLHMSTLGDAAEVNPVIKFLPHTLHVCGRNLICPPPSTYKVGQKIGVSLPPLTCSPSEWPSRLVYHRGRKSRRTYELPCIVPAFAWRYWEKPIKISASL